MLNLITAGGMKLIYLWVPCFILKIWLLRVGIYKGTFPSPLGWFFLVDFTLTIYKRSLILADLNGTEAKIKD